ncbi:MAG TPA: aspartate aminotransferase family protein [Thermomicrobiales bacterium]|nr:aspartate aminotransferase family protein [Thermomicrobiales bacterium]
MVYMDMASEERVRQNDRAHVFHSWSAQGQINPLPVAGEEGGEFFDFEGKRYLDFASQLVYTNLGHQHPKVVAAIKEQAERLCVIQPSFANEPASELAALLAELAPGDLNMTFFTNAGAEANENAIRIARMATGRHKILAAWRSYHGATHGAIALTGDPRRWASEPAISGVVHFMGPYTYRSSFHSESEEQERDRALAHLEEVLMYEGPQTVAGIILEVIVGTNGILVPPDGYLQGVREICDRHGIVMILDEVMTGFGRTGYWFGSEGFGVEPDLISCAKGLTSGYVPLGAVLISQKIADKFQDKVYYGGLTYSGHPLACAAGVGAITAMKEEKVVENAKMIGDDVLGPGLRELQKKHKSIGDVRGRGCFWGVELVKNRETREMLAPFNASGAQMGAVGEMTRAAMNQGLSLMVHWNVIMIAPPLIITPAEAKRGLSVLDEVLEIADKAAD